MSNQKILKNSCKWLEGKGILTALTSLDVPWHETITGQPLDDDYYGNRSGSKILSSLAETLADENGELDTTATNRLATIIFNKYNTNWTKAYEALTVDYNPIHNYDGEESYTETRAVNETIDRDVTDGYTKTNTGTQGVSGSDTGTVGTTGSDTGTQRNVKDNTGTVGTTGSNTGTQTNSGTNTGTQTDSGSKTNTGTQGTTGSNTGTQTNDNDIYGFNSSNASHADKDTRTDALEHSETRTDNLTETTGNTRTDNLAHSDTRTDNLAHSETVTNNLKEDTTRTDNLSHSETRTDNLAHTETRTDNLSEVNSGTTAEDISKATAETITHELERGGNYGMTTTQKMVTEEIILRQTYNFFDSVVFPDIDKVMVLNNFEENGIFY